MADLKFTCPKCRQSLEAPEDMLGQTVQCPSCSTTITVPARAATAAAYEPPPRMKECPFCSEQILATAKKCKHCGETVDVALRAAEEAKRNQGVQMVNINAQTSAKPTATETDKPWSAGEMTILVILTLLIPLIGIVCGIMGLSKESRKGQGAVLLVIAIVLIVIYCIMFAS